MGTPITIDQIHITQMENGKHQVSFCFDTEEVDKEHYLGKGDRMDAGVEVV